MKKIIIFTLIAFVGCRPSKDLSYELGEDDLGVENKFIPRITKLFPVTETFSNDETTIEPETITELATTQRLEKFKEPTKYFDSLIWRVVPGQENLVKAETTTILSESQTTNLPSKTLKVETVDMSEAGTTHLPIKTIVETTVAVTEAETTNLPIVASTQRKGKSLSVNELDTNTVINELIQENLIRDVEEEIGRNLSNQLLAFESEFMANKYMGVRIVYLFNLMLLMVSFVTSAIALVFGCRKKKVLYVNKK
ncbi:MAG: hypothetical protein ACRYGG_03815 [Janthinobacterium lividum]